jgi:hypothetical protein
MLIDFIAAKDLLKPILEDIFNTVLKRLSVFESIDYLISCSVYGFFFRFFLLT